jgi:hypothetical protein
MWVTVQTQCRSEMDQFRFRAVNIQNKSIGPVPIKNRSDSKQFRFRKFTQQDPVQNSSDAECFRFVGHGYRKTGKREKKLV